MGRERGACGAWARCVWGVGGVRVGRRRDACTGLGKCAPLKRSDLGKSEREVQICQNHCIFHAPPAHLLPQYCTLLGKTRPRHRPRTGRQLQTADCAPPDSVAPALPVRTACPPHPALPDHPQTLTPPANSETPRPPNGRRGVNTQRAVSARRLTRQLRKSPRPQRRHLRYRLLARPLRERQRPQEQQRG